MSRIFDKSVDREANDRDATEIAVLAATNNWQHAHGHYPPSVFTYVIRRFNSDSGFQHGLATPRVEWPGAVTPDRATTR